MDGRSKYAQNKFITFRFTHACKGRRHLSHTPARTLRMFAENITGTTSTRLWTNTTDPEIIRKLQTITNLAQHLLKIHWPPVFYQIDYDEQYMPELFLPLPELQHKRNDQLLMI